MKLLPVIHRQVATENAIAFQLKLARAAHARAVMLTAMREIGRLLATELALLEIGTRSTWLDHLQRRTGITLGEMELATIAHRTHLAKTQTRLLPKAASPEALAKGDPFRN